MSTYLAIVKAPGFSIGIDCDADAIRELAFLPPRAEKSAPDTPAGRLAREAARQVREWLADPDFVFGLPLTPCGTPFRQKVWAAISDIPRGETRSYGEIATQLRSAPRAVGGACGANPYPL